MTTSPVTKNEILDLCRRYRSWGRWGADDEAGTLNEVTSDKVRAAAQQCVSGRVFSLALPFDADGPQSGDLGRTNPIHVMLQDGGDISSGAQRHLNMEYTDDAIYMPLQCGTQWDALAHVFHDGKMYNGFGTEQVTSSGAVRNGIDKTAGRFVGRGVLMDLARYKCKDALEPAEPISHEDLVACARRQGCEVEAGDFVLVRTGHLGAVRRQGAWGDYVGGPSPGLAVRSLPFFCERRVAAVATDTWTVEVWPAEVPEVRAAAHIVLLVSAGIHLGEMFDLEELSDACAADGQYSFLFAAPALPITGGVGSPINPIAIK